MKLFLGRTHPFRLLGPALLACFVLTVALPAFQEAAGDGGLLERARSQMAENYRSLPNYTCTETIQRVQRGGRCAGCEFLDRVRLEVAVLGNRERFALPGASAFDDIEIESLVPPGPVTSGDYAGLVWGLFVGRGASYTYRGREPLNGRMLARYDFSLPAEHARFKLRAGADEATTGVAGSFWLDPESGDVMRLEANLREIPPDFEIFRANSVSDYRRVRGSRASFVVPSRTDWQIEHRSGRVSRLRAEFAGCHEFVGESVIHFEEQAPETGPANASAIKATPVQIPPGAFVYVQFAQAIDFDTSAVGDRVVAFIDAPVKKDGVIVAPKGTVVHGRIVRLERQSSAGSTRDHDYAVGVRLTHLESRGALSPFHAAIDDGTFSVLGRASGRRFGKGPNGEALIVFTGDASRINKGMRLTFQSTDGK